MALALAEASDVLKDPSLLQLAKQALTFSLSGMDDKLGGGIYWRENEKKGKNTCSNAPVVAACLAIYSRSGDPSLLKTARRLYEWTKKNLQDPADSLLWDNVSLEGKIDRTKWSYNSALMLRSAADLFRITGEPHYAADAEAMANASESKCIVDAKLADAGRFAHLLVESWMLFPSPDRLEEAREAMQWLYESGRSPGGLYGGRFDRAVDPDQRKFELIDTASAARAFLLFKAGPPSLPADTSFNRPK
jgi:uncharacterized protein YyaL (SSP411 family)